MVRWKLCKKVPGKMFLEKNMEIKTSKKVQFFSSPSKKMSLEIKSCVLDSWDFFHKIVLGQSMSQEIRSQEIVLRKIYPKKSPKSCKNEFKYKTFS